MIFTVLLTLFSTLLADSPQAGEFGSRNMVSAEQNLTESFLAGSRDNKTGEITGASPNVRWVSRIGARSYTVPVIADGLVFIGTSNEAELDPSIEGDRGVLLCFDEITGKIKRQIIFPKVDDIRFFDAPNVGLTSPPSVHDGKVYFVSNRSEVVCMSLDYFKNADPAAPVSENTVNWEKLLLEHFADNNPQFSSDETPKQSEMRWAPALQKSPCPGVLWVFDIVSGCGVRQHDTNNHSILIHKGLLYIGTANGLNADHTEVEKPDAPALIVLEAETGKLLAQDSGWVGKYISHGQWTSPTLGRVKVTENGKVSEKELIFFVGGNGVLYAFEEINSQALIGIVPDQTSDLRNINPVINQEESANGIQAEHVAEHVFESNNCLKIEPNWIFKGEPAEQESLRKSLGLEKKQFHIGSGGTSYCGASAPVFADGKLYVQFGTDIANSGQPRNGWVVCVNPQKVVEQTEFASDKTEPQDATGIALHFGSDLYENGVLGPLAVKDGLLYFADRKGTLRCLDAETGTELWNAPLVGEVWGGILVADEKIYVGTDRRHFYIFRTGKKPEMLADIAIPDAVFAAPAAANGTVFIPVCGFLYAVEK
ncbi:MAG: PQQ-binding-like beta-propeller repeat protein [Thermoguttaceae bacterium]